MGEWHPILAAVEGPTGTWRMIDPHGHEYGRVEIRRVMNGQQVAYKAIHAGHVIGWSHTLRVACLKVHMAFLSSLRPGGGPAADWGELTGNGRTRSPRGGTDAAASTSRHPDAAEPQRNPSSPGVARTSAPPTRT